MARCCGDDPGDSRVPRVHVDRSALDLMRSGALGLLSSNWPVMEIAQMSEIAQVSERVEDLIYLGLSPLRCSPF